MITNCALPGENIQKIRCLSSDKLPVDIENGSEAFLMDDNLTRYYDGENRVWITSDDTLKKIDVTTEPTTVEYYEGAALDLTGLVVKSTAYDGTVATVDNDDLIFSKESGAALSRDDTIITITLKTDDGNEYTAEVELTIIPVVSIDVSTEPTTVAYTAGQTFDPTGMVVTATYENEQTAAVTGYTYEPDGELTVDDDKITITYYGATTEQEITVTEE